MLEPAVPSRLSVVAIAAAVLISGLVLGGCQPDEASPPPAVAPRPDAPAVPVSVNPPAAALDRASLLRAMDDAASAYAAGGTNAAVSLVGRRFRIRQAFGCDGPSRAVSERAPADAQAVWFWSEDEQSIRIRLSPGDWTAWPLISGDPGRWEAAEGIWLTQPWMKAEGCPKLQSDPLAGETPAGEAQTMGLVAVFEKDGSRLGRRNGRAYEFVVRGDSDRPPAAPVGGYRLILEGRMTAFPEGRAVRCSAADAHQRPVCVGAVQLDRVAIEDASGGVLSEWRGG